MSSNTSGEAPTSNERLTDRDLRELIRAYEAQINPTPLFADAVKACLRELQERRGHETAAEPSVAVLSDAATEFARYQLHEAKGRLQLSAYDMLTCAFLKGVAFSMHGYKFVPPLPVKTSLTPATRYHTNCITCTCQEPQE